MSGNKFVRSSKFRHVFGTPAKRDKCYDNIRISKGPHESNMSSVNRKFLAVVVEVQGGGSFVVLPLEKVRLRLSSLASRDCSCHCYCFYSCRSAGLTSTILR